MSWWWRGAANIDTKGWCLLPPPRYWMTNKQRNCSANFFHCNQFDAQQFVWSSFVRHRSPTCYCFGRRRRTKKFCCHEEGFRRHSLSRLCHDADVLGGQDRDRIHFRSNFVPPPPMMLCSFWSWSTVVCTDVVSYCPASQSSLCLFQRYRWIAPPKRRLQNPFAMHASNLASSTSKITPYHRVYSTMYFLNPKNYLRCLWNTN